MKSKKLPRPISKTGVQKKAAKPAAPAPAADVSASAAPPSSGADPQSPLAPRRRTPPRQPLQVPPILLEGDSPVEQQRSGPGARYALGPEPPAARFGPGWGGELPAAYGTKRLLLVARDPHWLYAHWDLTDAQLREYNNLSADRHLVLRINRDVVTDVPHAEVHVHPESRNWFVHVGVGATRYIAILGYYTNPDRRWVQVAVSAPTFTPPDSVSDDTSVHFATIPLDVSFDELIAIVKVAIAEHVPLAEAMLQLKAAGYADLPSLEEFATNTWTPLQEQAMARILSMDSVRRIWLGSMEITELVRRQLGHQVSSAAAAQIGLWQPALGALGALGSVSSPYGGAEQKRAFWFNVNAELVIYGATEPDAEVRIGGRHIQLRHDGTFSYRFALPDGEYQLPATATSADGEDQRGADLRFGRHSFYLGEVTAHPQDPALKTPHPGHLD